MSDDREHPPSLARLLLHDAPADLAAAAWMRAIAVRRLIRSLRRAEVRQ